jgi:hypothetical protein
MYGHLATVLEEIDFRDRTQSGGTHLMKRIRRLLQRAEPDERGQYPARDPDGRAAPRRSQEPHG